MNDFNIRITRRFGNAEESIEIDCSKLPHAACIHGTVETINHATTAAPSPLEWSRTLCDDNKVNYAAAEKACAALGDGWRLPGRMELESILDLTQHDPATDTARFPDTKSGWYWTSTPCAWSSDLVWIVSFYYGSAGGSNRSSDGFVRAVRSVPAGQ